MSLGVPFACWVRCVQLLSMLCSARHCACRRIAVPMLTIPAAYAYGRAPGSERVNSVVGDDACTDMGLRVHPDTSYSIRHACKRTAVLRVHMCLSVLARAFTCPTIVCLVGVGVVVDCLCSVLCVVRAVDRLDQGCWGPWCVRVIRVASRSSIGPRTPTCVR